MATLLKEFGVLTAVALSFIAGPIAAGMSALTLSAGAFDIAVPAILTTLVTLPVLWWAISGTPPMIRISRTRNHDTGHALNTRYRALLLVPVLDRGRLLRPGLVFVTDTASGWGSFDRWLRVRSPNGPRAIRVGD